MRIKHLLLSAFGPFTAASLDFTSAAQGAAANLHLIYGANEAGKSSALRAMLDLRFGIPLRSGDSFLHPAKKIRLGGVFAAPGDRELALLRRKGHKPTLHFFDPADETLQLGREAGPEEELALTGGMERQEYELMFGLDHRRLRRGGDLLIRGEGELGAALFEASAGTRGVTGILSDLEAAARELYNPHGNAQHDVIKKARKTLQEQKALWQAAQTRPAQWHELNRAHEQAREEFRELSEALEAARRKANELTELRTVAPLLHECDRTAELVRELAAAPELAEDAREVRLAAQQALVRALADRDKAERGLGICRAGLAPLAIEPEILEHGLAIERLAQLLPVIVRARVELRQQQARISQVSEEMAAIAARIAPGREPGAILAEVPSAAERVALDEHLNQLQRLELSLENLGEQTEKLTAEEQEAGRDDAPLPGPAVIQRVENALQQARELGDTRRKQEELQRKIQELGARQQRLLADLGVAAMAELHDARPLLDQQIQARRQELQQLREAEATLRDEARRLHGDLARLQTRQRQLAAAGEVITAETLRLARHRRDQGWQLIRAAYVERTGEPAELARAHSFNPEQSLPEAFEAAVSDADRQADILRADASRAATFAECAQRIEQMELRQRELAAELQGLEDRRQAAAAGWRRRLGEARLPEMEAEALEEWQKLRERAIDNGDGLEQLRVELRRLQSGESQAVTALAAALPEARPEARPEESRPARPEAPPKAGELPATFELSRLIKQATRWGTEVTARQATRTAGDQARKTRQQSLQDLRQKMAAAAADRQRHRAALAGFGARLWLPEGSGPEVFRARLGEVDALQRLAGDVGQWRLDSIEKDALIDDFEQRGRNLAKLLGEPAPEQAEDFVERLQVRLDRSREQEGRRQAGQRELARLEAERQAAITEGARQDERLLELCRVAGAEDAGRLPEREALAARKRQAGVRLAEQRKQLAEASARDEAELRRLLAGVDIVAIEAEQERCRHEIKRLTGEAETARIKSDRAGQELAAIDASDAAAKAREAMEAAAAQLRAAIRPWARLRLARALLQEALGRFRERARGPMVDAASGYFALMTGGRYPRLLVDEEHERPVLRAEREDGSAIGVEAMSEGTADQLYLALRLAALKLRREQAGSEMPLILDDVLVTSDDQRAANILRALARFARQNQVLLFTHHRHIVELAGETLAPGEFAAHRL